MAFVRYQKVRNRVLGVFAAIGATVGGIFGYQSMSESGATDAVAARSAGASWQEDAPAATVPAPSPKTERTQSPSIARENAQHLTQKPNEPSQRSARQPTKNERYASAMKLASANSRKAAKAKDVLGIASPWKLNLYDDNQDGAWDRAKLDTNRDEVDDENWTYKNGYWEKEDGQKVWSTGKWVSRSALVKTPSNAAGRKLARYRAALKIATARANASGKGKDVLGSSSLWKLNLYDDDLDGQWDRAKLDTNRDEVDDEKWTYKKGRWEKEGGQLVWANSNWVAASSIVPKTATSTLDWYRQAFKIATARADSSGKGKDVLGAKSPWKLNLYDDNRDGQWDRAKLDTNRDEVDDEKWTFKSGRWEKDGGRKIWVGNQWQSASSSATPAKSSASPTLARYQTAMKLASGRADRSGKGKDVLGSRSPWKLNLYDDDRDGTWDRGKLDTNRDEVDDEKWNFKNGRWEKDGGATIWDGSKWIPSR